MERSHGHGVEQIAPPHGEASTSLRALLDAARDGDLGARDRLFEHIHPRLYRLAHWQMSAEVRVRRPWLAPLFGTADIVQEVCQRVLADLPGIDAYDERSLFHCLSVVVRNRLFDVLRYHEAACRDCRRIAAIGADRLSSTLPGPATRVVNEELVAAFWQLVGTLTEREQRLLRLRAEDAGSFGEVARELGYPSPDAARKALYVLQAELLVRMRRRGFTSEARA